MVSSSDFNLSLDILHRVASPSARPPFQGQFSEGYAGQGVITTALKLIHKASQEGTSAQRNELAQFRHEVIALNALLAQNQIAERVEQSLDIRMEDEAGKLTGMKIAVPQTGFEKMLEIASLIPRLVFAIITDIILLPIAGGLLLYMLTKPNLDPAQPKTDAVPILLLHGSGFNESEWVLGRQFLKAPKYGSVFSLNYDGLVSNDPVKGIDDYAAGKVRDKILKIKELTGQDRLILMGHSMGGMIAGYYAENFASQDNMQIEHVISIASPWRGSPAVDRFMLGENALKRYCQMSSDHSFRRNLMAQALDSERAGRRNYYSIGSTTDFAVSGFSSMLTEDPRRQRMFSCMGHYGIIASLRVWSQVRAWLDMMTK